MASSASGASWSSLRLLKFSSPDELLSYVNDKVRELEAELLQARREIEARGAKVLTCTHALAGVERAFRREFGLWLPVELVAIVLRRVFCEGVKVAIEVTMMAVDAGLIPEGEDVVAVAGTGRGADTALHIKSASTSNFLKLKVRRVICKPDTF